MDGRLFLLTYPRLLSCFPRASTPSLFLPVFNIFPVYSTGCRSEGLVLENFNKRAHPAVRLSLCLPVNVLGFLPLFPG